MPPKISVVRHAQGYHNATENYALRDPLLTPLGKEQCARLSSTFLSHSTIDIILCSPLRRTIQTAAYSFGPALKREDLKFVLLPALQEVSDMGSDTGLGVEELKEAIPEMFKGEDVGFDLQKIDTSQVTEGWNDKTGYWAYTKEALSKRSQDLRNYLFQRSEDHIVLVSHGAILHFITEDWDVDDPMTATAYKNCETREFRFTSASTSEDAHLEEEEGSKGKRAAPERENDPHVVDELNKAVHGVQN